MQTKLLYKTNTNKIQTQTFTRENANWNLHMKIQTKYKQHTDKYFYKDNTTDIQHTNKIHTKIQTKYKQYTNKIQTKSDCKGNTT